MTVTHDRPATTDLPEPRPAPTGEELRASTDIQGNVLAAFNKDWQSLLFLQLPSAEQGRQWLNAMLPGIATTAQVATFNRAFSQALRVSGSDPERLTAVWVGLSLTAPGLQLLAPEALAQLQADGVDGDRGLVFACYQASIADQFEFLQETWANDPAFPDGNAGPDPIIGSDGAVVLHGEGNSTAQLPVLRRFVRTRGSLYAVTPSLPALRALAAGELR